MAGDVGRSVAHVFEETTDVSDVAEREGFGLWAEAALAGGPLTLEGPHGADTDRTP